jgi:hypothetical protein
LKRGINVTLYPLPFRKGGKIQNGTSPAKGAPPIDGFAQGGQFANKTMGDKTTKPGIEFNNGGVTPISGLRSAFTGDPKKKKPATQQQHTQQHTAALVNKMQTEDGSLLKRYQEALAVGDKVTADGVLLAMGGIPEFVPPPKTSTPSNLPPTDWKNLGFSGANKTGGYRYNAGQGKPAQGSITNTGLGMRRSKFGK